MDNICRLSHYSVEMALIDMVRSSPALQLADNLMAHLNSGSAAWSALQANIMGTVRSLQVREGLQVKKRWPERGNEWNPSSVHTFERRGWTPSHLPPPVIRPPVKRAN
eukprot:355536-Chlamydomonas_euryale.AAC.3